MYQSESSPAIIRGVVISTYQLFITLGMWSSELVNLGTHSMTSSASWRIPNGLGFLWSLLLGAGILFLPESPRYAARKGRVDDARLTIAQLAGLNPDGPSVARQMAEIAATLDEEKQAGPDTKWYAFVTGPRMLYRIILGVVLQAGQQLTGGQLLILLRHDHLQIDRPGRRLPDTDDPWGGQLLLHLWWALRRG